MMVVYPWKCHIFFIAFFCLLAVLECRPFGNLPTKKYRLQADVLPEGVKKNGNDLWIEKPGAYNLTLLNNQLELGTALQTCDGEITACYNSRSSDQSHVRHKCPASTCAFYLTMTATEFWFMQPSQPGYGKPKHQFQDLSVVLTGNSVDFGGLPGPSCKPNINNKHTHIQVKEASLECPVIIKNADIRSPEVTTHSVGHDGSSTTESSGTAMADWLIAVIVIASILALGLLCGLCCWIYIRYFKKKDSKQISSGTTKNTVLQIGDQTEGANTDKTKPVEAKTMLPITCAPAKQVLPDEIKANKPAECRPVEKTEELATAKPAPVESKGPVEAPTKPQVVAEPVPKAPKEPKADAKEVVKDDGLEKENKAATDVAQEENGKPPSNFQVIHTSQLRRNCWPSHPDAVVSKLPNQSNKSGSGKSKKKADSLQMRMQGDHQHLVPIHIYSISSAFGIAPTLIAWRTLKRYPPAPFVLEREVHLLLCPVSEMFEELVKMGADAEDRLLKAGLVLDSKKRIVGEINERVRNLIMDRKTPEYVRSYMFSLEFGKLMTPRVDNLDRMSLSLLFVVAIGPMFDVLVRKQAAAHLRRKQVTVQKWWFAEERSRMPFPISALEVAYKMDRCAFCDEHSIKTDSQRSKRERAALKKEPSADNITIETETREEGGKSVNQS